MKAKQPVHKTKLGSSSSVRLTIQLVFLAVTILIGLRHLLPGESSRGGAFDAFCPFGALETGWLYLTTGRTLLTTSLLNFSIFLGVIGVSLLAGRAFCGWMCPLGTIQDLLAGFSPRLVMKIKDRKAGTALKLPASISARNDAWLRPIKYLILGIVLLASTWAVYPPLREFCPARGFFSFQLTGGLLWSVVLTFTITSLLNRRFWCKYLCPLGAALAPFNKISPLRLVASMDRCTSCQRCDSACPMDISNVIDNLRSPECTQCLECQEACSGRQAIHLQLF